MFFYQTSKKLPGSNPLVGFVADARARATDAFTDLTELTFETKKLLVGRGNQ